MAGPVLIVLALLLLRVLMLMADALGYQNAPGVSLTGIAVVIGIMGAVTATVGTRPSRAPQYRRMAGSTWRAQRSRPPARFQTFGKPRPRR